MNLSKNLKTISNLQALNENIENIDIGHSAYDILSDKSNRTQIWMDIDFSRKDASFHILGEGNPELKDWIDGAFEEMKRIAQALELEDKRTIKLLKKEFGENWKKTTVVKDFRGEIKNKLKFKLKEEKPLLIKVVSKENWYTTWWGKIIIGVIVGVIVGLIFILLR